MIKLKPIIENFEQNDVNKIINSQQFKTWFGNSKVVDSSGRPLVVYHGGTVTDKFDNSFIGKSSGMRDYGFSFSTNEHVAKVYANVSRVYSTDLKGSHNKYFLRIPKLVTYDAEYKFALNARWNLISKWWNMWDLQEFHKQGKSLRSYDVKYELYTFEKTDGILFKNMYEVQGSRYLGDTYIVFDSEDIWRI